MARMIPPYWLGEKIGHNIDISAGTVSELLKEAKERFGQDFEKATEYHAVLVNGIDMCKLKGRRTPLEDGDYVAFANTGFTGLPEE